MRGRKGEYSKVLEEMRAEGYVRAEVDGEVRRLDDEIELDKQYKHDIAVVVDRLIMKEGLRKRLAESIEAASRLADGLVEVESIERSARRRGRRGADAVAGRAPASAARCCVFSEKFACLNCGTSMPELEPRIFSFNSPHGACPSAATASASSGSIDPELVVPDPTLSISEGALSPWIERGIDVLPAPPRGGRRGHGIDTEMPWQDLADDATGGSCSRAPATSATRSPTRTASGGGATTATRSRGSRSASSAATRTPTRTRPGADRGPDGLQPCPGLRRRAAAAGEPRGDGRRAATSPTFAKLSARNALESIGSLELTETEQAIARLIVREVEERLAFLVEVGIDYLTLDRAATTLSGGEAQRIRLATQIGSGLVGVLYILDEPSIGLHQRDNAQLIATLERLRDLGNTVIVVEHDEDTMRAADYLVDLGPGAGEHGGEIVSGAPRRR